MNGEKMDSKAVKERLAEHGIKATMQRIVIYSALVESREHPSAYVIYNAIKDDNPSISLSTVYNTLDSFVAHKLINIVKHDSGVIHYDAFREMHHHLYCSETNQIADFYNEKLNSLLQDFFANNEIPGFDVKEFSVEIKGSFKN